MKANATRRRVDRRLAALLRCAGRSSRPRTGAPAVDSTLACMTTCAVSDTRRVWRSRPAMLFVRTSSARARPELPDGNPDFNRDVAWCTWAVIGSISAASARAWRSAGRSKPFASTPTTSWSKRAAIVTRPVAAPDGGPWRIGVEDPLNPDQPIAVLAVSDRAVATSSVRIRRWTAGSSQVHHLIDPRTGLPGGAGLCAVTVVGDDVADAEVNAKTLFLEGRDAIADAVRSELTAACWVTTDGRPEFSTRLRAVHPVAARVSAIPPTPVRLDRGKRWRSA